jgi:hypothetical protein
MGSTVSESATTVSSVTFAKKRLLILVLFVDHRGTVYKRRALPGDFEREADEGQDATQE